MADSFELIGSYKTEPLGGDTSFEPVLTAAFNEALQLTKKRSDCVSLSADPAEAVSFGGVTNAHVVILKVLSGASVQARLTSTHGATQSIPVNTALVLLSTTNPITAIDLIRSAGTASVVQVFLGEIS